MDLSSFYADKYCAANIKRSIITSILRRIWSGILSNWNDEALDQLPVEIIREKITSSVIDGLNC